MDEYVNAVVEEIIHAAKKIDGRDIVHTIYLGGGTPNLLSPQQIAVIIARIRENINCESKIEISMEANPTCLPGDYLESIREIGINRLSIGMQSASENDLKILGRKHSIEDVKNSVMNARNAGFSNISLDLIFGIPLQTLMSFEKTLEAAFELSPDHLSLYALSIEDSTPLAAQIAKGEFPEPDDDLAADMYILAMELLEGRGYSQYEISNWAHGDENQCRHNLQYWRNQDYLGFGAGAHSHYRKSRWENVRYIKDYVDSVSDNIYKDNCVSQAGINFMSLSEKDEMSETMMMGMRLTQEGINSEDFTNRFGASLEEIYSKEIADLRKRELIEWIADNSHEHLRLTKKGKLLGNQVFMEFIRD